MDNTGQHRCITAPKKLDVSCQTDELDDDQIIFSDAVQNGQPASAPRGTRTTANAATGGGTAARAPNQQPNPPAQPPPAAPTPKEITGAADTGGEGSSKTKTLMQTFDVDDSTLRVKISQFSKMSDTLCSESKKIQEVPWRIMVMPKQHMVQKKSQKCMGFFLQCCPENTYSDTWSCHAVAEMRLMSEKANVQNFVRKTTHVYTAKENDWGYSCFMTWADVLDENQGYIKEDTVTLEIQVKADLPKSMMTRDEFRKTLDRWYDLAELQKGRGQIDKAIEANLQALNNCKDKDEEYRAKLDLQKEELVKLKLFESINRIEKGPDPKAVEATTCPTSLRQALTGAQKTITGAKATEKRPANGTAKKERRGTATMVKQMRKKVEAKNDKQRKGNPDYSSEDGGKEKKTAPPTTPQQPQAKAPQSRPPAEQPAGCSRRSLDGNDIRGSKTMLSVRAHVMAAKGTTVTVVTQTTRRTQSEGQATRQAHPTGGLCTHHTPTDTLLKLSQDEQAKRAAAAASGDPNARQALDDSRAAEASELPVSSSSPLPGYYKTGGELYHPGTIRHWNQYPSLRNIPWLNPNKDGSYPPVAEENPAGAKALTQSDLPTLDLLDDEDTPSELEAQDEHVLDVTDSDNDSECEAEEGGESYAEGKCVTRNDLCEPGVPRDFEVRAGPEEGWVEVAECQGTEAEASSASDADNEEDEDQDQDDEDDMAEQVQDIHDPDSCEGATSNATTAAAAVVMEDCKETQTDPTWFTAKTGVSSSGASSIASTGSTGSSGASSKAGAMGGESSAGAATQQPSSLLLAEAAVQKIQNLGLNQDDDLGEGSEEVDVVGDRPKADAAPWNTTGLLPEGEAMAITMTETGSLPNNFLLVPENFHGISADQKGSTSTASLAGRRSLPPAPALPGIAHYGNAAAPQRSTQEQMAELVNIGMSCLNAQKAMMRTDQLLKVLEMMFDLEIVRSTLSKMCPGKTYNFGLPKSGLNEHQLKHDQLVESAVKSLTAGYMDEDGPVAGGDDGRTQAALLHSISREGLMDPFFHDRPDSEALSVVRQMFGREILAYNHHLTSIMVRVEPLINITEDVRVAMESGEIKKVIENTRKNEQKAVELEAKVKRLEADLNREREAKKKLEGESAVMKMQRDEATTRNEELSTQLKDRRNELRKIEKKSRTDETRVAELIAEKDDLDDKLKKAKAEFENFKKKAADDRGKIKKELDKAAERVKFLEADSSDKEAEREKEKQASEARIRKFAHDEANHAKVRKALETQMATQSERARKAEMSVLEAEMGPGMRTLERALADAEKREEECEAASKAARTTAELEATRKYLVEWRAVKTEIQTAISKTKAEFVAAQEAIRKGEKTLASLTRPVVPGPPPAPKMMPPVPRATPPMVPSSSGAAPAPPPSVTMQQQSVPTPIGAPPPSHTPTPVPAPIAAPSTPIGVIGYGGLASSSTPTIPANAAGVIGQPRTPQPNRDPFQSSSSPFRPTIASASVTPSASGSTAGSMGTFGRMPSAVPSPPPDGSMSKSSLPPIGVRPPNHVNAQPSSSNTMMGSGGSSGMGLGGALGGLGSMNRGGGAASVGGLGSSSMERTMSSMMGSSNDPFASLAGISRGLGGSSDTSVWNPLGGGGSLWDPMFPTNLSSPATNSSNNSMGSSVRGAFESVPHTQSSAVGSSRGMGGSSMSNAPGSIGSGPGTIGAPGQGGSSSTRSTPYAAYEQGLSNEFAQFGGGWSAGPNQSGGAPGGDYGAPPRGMGGNGQQQQQPPPGWNAGWGSAPLQGPGQGSNSGRPSMFNS